MIPFAKYQAAGNDFILIDDRKSRFLQKTDTIQRLCHRQFGIGADGLILLQHSQTAHLRMRIFNSDGSEAEMCGNGIRCLFHFAQQQASLMIETMHEKLACYFVQEKVATLLPHPEIRNTLAFVSGVPHAITFVDDLKAVDVETAGRAIRFDSRFAPQGANATFVQRCEGGTLHVCTYERGVEKATLACGTGAVAAAFMAQKTFSLPDLVKVLTPSKEILEIRRTDKGLELCGDVKQVFCGFVN